MASSLYIHLPFCKTKCPYCDFASFTDDSNRKRYLDALKNEIDFRCSKFSSKAKLKTIFFGGGTPSVHSAEELAFVFDSLRPYFDFDESTEITLEANPGTVDKIKLQEFKDVGINRLSLGVQTFDDELITYLARGHSVQEAKEIIELVKELKFNSWSIDLIYGLPHQSLDQWKKTIDIALSYDPPHLSSYALSIEPDTPFGKIYIDSKHKDLPQEESVVEMYNYLNDKLEENEIYRYEISNWAKQGQEAKHNLCYWQADEYYAFGLSAHGFINKTRYANIRDISKYQEIFQNKLATQSQEDFQIQEQEIIETVDDQKALEEKIFLNMRLKSGLELNEKLKEKINSEKLDNFINQGFIEMKDKRLILTKNALMISNKIIFELIK